MTVGVLVKVFDGLVLAADSASTFRGEGVTQVYNNANKVFHLHRGLPLGAMTWGLGNIGSASNATLAKDLRVRLMGLDEGRPEWALDEGSYTVEQVAAQARDMLFEAYVGEYGPGGDGAALADDLDPLGFLVAGYSAGEQNPEAWEIMITNAHERPAPRLVAATDAHGWLTFAQPEATRRLFYGIDPYLVHALKALVPPADHDAMDALLASAVREPVLAAMPFVDAVGLARFLAETTIGYSHHLPGSDTVGGPVDVAGISRHEGFKWLARKHYFNSDLNPQ